MNRSHTIVIDVSNNHDDDTALRSAADASIELDVDLVLIGDEQEIWDALREIAHDAERVRLVHSDQQVPGDDNGIITCLRFLRDNPHATLITGSHAPRLVEHARSLLRTLPTIKQPALAAVYPTLHTHGEQRDPFALLLDVGATNKCSDGDLVRFATMGAAYAGLITSNSQPRVGLLVNSDRPQRWPKRIQRANHWLTTSPLPFEYAGVVRADEVTLGHVDVLVTDGFTGDIQLRTMEEVALTAEKLLELAREKLKFRVGFSLLGEGMNRLRELADWENYGGTPLLGFDRSIIVNHQRASRRSYFNAIRLARKIERLNLVGRLDSLLLELEANRPPELAAKKDRV
jgi:glycerol-3-phosphate acyltransferase PlsX